jgi:hypothetical protein
MRLNAFLAKLSARIAPHKAVRNIVIPQMNSPEVVDSFEPEFRKELENFFEYRAIDMMDHLAVNEYWFLKMAAAALVKSRSLPATPTDVQEGIFVLRHRIWREAEGSAIFNLLLHGQGDKLTAVRTDYAKQEGLLVWGESYNGSMLMKVNPVFFANTGGW